MGIELGKNLNIGNFALNIGANKVANSNFFVSNNNNITTDTFTRSKETTNPIGQQTTVANYLQSILPTKQLLKAFTNTSFVENLLVQNPNIIKMLNDKGIDAQVYPENIAITTKDHLEDTVAYARDIANQMNLSNADKKTLEQASMLHDFGKILIPPEILNKPGTLNDKEKEIMDLHSELGYELLKTAGINSRVTNLIKNHHNPTADNSDTLSEILSVADIYSALREERSYKTSMSEEDAFKILDQKAEKGEVSTEVVEKLKDSRISEAA